MPPTTKLFDLINSLSPSEKRYFKLYTSFQKGSKNYLKLFEAIDSQKIYNEKAIRHKHSNENFIKHLTYNKNYLSSLIFKSLNLYTNEKSIDSKLNNFLTRCKFLFSKSLFGEFFKTIQAGKEIARKYERFSYLLEFLEIERQLTKKEELTKKNMNEIYDEELQIIEKIKNINSYKRIVSDLFRIYWTDGIVRSKAADDQINRILQDKKHMDQRLPSSLIAMERFYFAMYLIYEIKGDAKRSFDYNRKRFRLISGNKKTFQKFIYDNYEESFLTLVTSAANAGKFYIAGSLFEKYIKIFNKSVNKEVDSAATYFGFKLLKLINEEKSEQDEDLIFSLEKFLIEYKGRINIDSYNVYYYNLSRYYFLRGKFEESLRIINILFESKYLKHTPNLEPYARILNILIHYELGNHKLLTHLIPATTKYLKSKNKLFKTESTLLKFIKKAIQLKDNFQIRKHFLILKEGVKLLRKNKYEKNGMKYFDYLKWADKKLN